MGKWTVRKDGNWWVATPPGHGETVDECIERADISGGSCPCNGWPLWQFTDAVRHADREARREANRG